MEDGKIAMDHMIAAEMTERRQREARHFEKSISRNVRLYRSVAIWRDDTLFRRF